MCIKLLQIYACGHSKTIVTTPCPHALQTAHQIPQFNDDQGPMRAPSPASSISPTFPRSAVADLPSQQGRSPLPSPRHTGPAPSPANPSPAFCFGAPGPSPTSPNYPSPSPTTSAFLRTSPLPGSPSLINLTPPDERVLKPDYCVYHFPRYLPQSGHPCIECYMRPEWETLRKRYVRLYQENHPMDNHRDTERLCGMGELVEKNRQAEMPAQGQDGRREGLLNVFVDGDEGAGRVGG